MVGHAAHFLRRLDRVSDAQVELALALYRDAELLRDVLSRASLPERAERLAISLDHPTEGPFVVVTREGRFVTCLGAGMRARGLTVITREQLDAAAASVQRMRDELARVRQLVASGAEGQAALAFKRMQQQGPRFAREDARTLIGAMPLIETRCCESLRELLSEAEQHAANLAIYRVDEPRRMTPLQRKYLLIFGDLVWTIANLVALVSPASFRRVYPDVDCGELVYAMALLSARWGTLSHTVRGLALVARGSRAALGHVKTMPREGSLQLYLWRELALAAIALRSAKRRAEAIKALTLKRRANDDPLESALEQAAAVCGRQLVKLIREPAKAEAVYLKISRSYAAAVAAGVPSGSQVSPEELAAVPDDVARLAWPTVALSLHDPNTLRHLSVLALGLPFFARASAEELFLPMKWARILIPERSPEEVSLWLAPYIEACGLAPTRRTITRGAKPGRNAPCTCGSGQKYKRCCGAGG